MNFKIDILLLVFSIFAVSIAALVAFDFVDRVQKSSMAARKYLMPIFAIAIGSGLWANHFLISLAFHKKIEIQHSPVMIFIGWIFAVGMGYVILTNASRRSFKFTSFMGGGVIAGFCVFALFYCASVPIADPTSVRFDRFSTTIAVLLSICVTTADIMIFFWVKNYSGKHGIAVKVFMSLLVALSIVIIHFGFNGAIGSLSEIAANHTNTITSNKLVGFIIALGLVCLFLLLFIFTLFFEKHGAQVFKLDVLAPLKTNEDSPTSLQDSLTRIPNRRAFQQHLINATKRCERSDMALALAFIDLDHFKPINDQYGHHIGDKVLAGVAERLNLAVRGCDFLARLGGDEFVAVIEEIKSNDDIVPIVERILKSIRTPFEVEGIHIEISCSIGIAISPRDGDIEKLVIAADAAMYKAKENGRNQFRFFDAEIELASDHILAMQHDIRNALKNNEFFLEYQPKVDCKTLSPVGAEALIRWNHPTKGILLPFEFLPAAERFGLVNQMNEWVVEECCRMLARAKKERVDLTISMNLASLQFRNANLVNDITKLLKFYDLAPNNLIFEIKETAAIKNQAQFKALLAKFKAANLKVALDDFGSHPLSLSYLQDLDVNELKLDQSFVSQLNRDVASRALIDALIRLAHALDLNVVAEGVETEDQRLVLVELGCNHMQGFLFSRSVSEESLLKLFAHLKVNFEITGQFVMADYLTVVD